MAVHDVERFPHIVRDPEVLRGEPTIAGTRIPVWAVVGAWRMRRDMSNILRAYPALTPALVDEARHGGSGSWFHERESDASGGGRPPRTGWAVRPCARPADGTE